MQVAVGGDQTTEVPARPQGSSLPGFALGAFVASRLVALIGFVAASRRTGRPLLDLLTNWDGAWYRLVVDNGYPHQVPEVLREPTGASQTTLGIFPLYSLIARGLKVVSPLGTKAALVVVALLAGLAASVLFAVLMRRLVDEGFARRATLAFVFLPTSAVLSFAYAETVAVAFALTCFVLLEHRRWELAGLAAIAAGASRPHGVLLVVPCLLFAVEAVRSTRQLRPLAAPALAGLGPVLVFGFLWHHTGNPVAFFDATAAGWGRTRVSIDPVLALPRFLGAPFDDPAITIFAIGLVALVLLTIPLLRWRPPPPYLWFTLAYLLFLLTNDRGVRGRYLLLAFPLLGAVAWQVRSARGIAVVSAVGGVLLAGATYYHSLDGSLPL
jgi:hypothetical protein